MAEAQDPTGIYQMHSGRGYVFVPSLMFQRETDIEVALEQLMFAQLLFDTWQQVHDRGSVCWNVRDGSACATCEAWSGDPWAGKKARRNIDKISDDPLFKKDTVFTDTGFDPLAV